MFPPSLNFNHGLKLRVQNAGLHVENCKISCILQANVTSKALHREAYRAGMTMGLGAIQKDQAIKLSDTDRQLIALLMQDSRRTYCEMGDILSISRTTVKDRIDRLMDAGVIKKFTIELAETEQNTNYGVGAFFNLRLKRPFCKVVQKTISGWPELVGSWSIAGGTDMMVYVNCTSDSELELLRDRLARHPEVDTLWTDMVLRQWVNRGNTHLDYNAEFGPDKLENRYTDLAPGIV